MFRRFKTEMRHGGKVMNISKALSCIRMVKISAKNNLPDPARFFHSPVERLFTLIKRRKGEPALTQPLSYYFGQR